MAENPIIEVRGLSKHFEARQHLFRKSGEGAGVLKAVDDVHFRIPKGHSLGIAGESGCGKTTTAKMLLKLYEPTSGTFIFNGKDITHLKGKEELKQFRKQAQLMFQNPFEALNPRFTIFRSLLEPLIVHDIGTKEERVLLIKQALEQVNLIPAENFFEKYPHQMSGGQLQRVVLARALVVDPIFLVADEPVSMLDVSVRAGVLNLMKTLTERLQLTTVYISHDLSLISYMCEQTAIMYLGKVVEIGDTFRVLHEPKHPYTQALLAAVPSPDPDEEPEEVRIKNHVPSPINMPKGCHFQDRCPYTEAICREQTPELRRVSTGQIVACHMVTPQIDTKVKREEQVI
ncbi:ABC transporter ATP-binding protein [Brevibacillus choshinensis]|uniref:ABC transporter ATP-binding protein n=1 Tax=Brevibacillus choshinensis TaxID=54911 RepID=UPI002E240E1B|nr:ABC transporter ATP-binding protein [Brevibacillus choshinensis]